MYTYCYLSKSLVILENVLPNTNVSKFFNKFISVSSKIITPKSAC